MLRLALDRLVSSLMALFGASVIAFVMLRITPGDPARLVLGPFASDEALTQLRAEMGLNLPLHEQYLRYIADFLTGNWGFSYTTSEPVLQQMASRLPATIELGLAAFAFAIAMAIILALLAAHHPGGIMDRVSRVIAIAGMGIPPFWLGIVLLLGLFEAWHWFPGPEGRMSPFADFAIGPTGLLTIDTLLTGNWSGFLDAVDHLVLPAITLGLMPLAFLTRLLRANLLERVKDPFIAFARSRGLTRWQALVHHALPNAALPTINAAGLLFGQLLAGSVLVEKTFNWPGVGALVSEAIMRQDFAVVQAFILLSAFIFVFANLAVDLFTSLLDPRIRHGKTP
jgi:peptide/nickel transport system permease protein